MYYHWTAFQYQIHFIYFLIRITISLMPKRYSKFYNIPANQKVIIMLLLWVGIQACIFVYTLWVKSSIGCTDNLHTMARDIIQNHETFINAFVVLWIGKVVICFPFVQYIWSICKWHTTSSDIIKGGSHSSSSESMKSVDFTACIHH